MVNKVFHDKLMTKLIRNGLTNKEIEIGCKIYLKNDIKIIENDTSSMSFLVDNKKTIKITNKNNELILYENNQEILINEVIYACILTYKRDYYIENEIGFVQSDIVSSFGYYYPRSVSQINHKEFLCRYKFYYGLIDKLLEINKIEQGLKIILDLYCAIECDLHYVQEIHELQVKDEYILVRDRSDLIINNIQILPMLFNSHNYSILYLGRLIYIMVVNNLSLLKNQKLGFIYDYIISFSSKKEKNTLLFSNIKRQRDILRWYNNEINDNFMLDNIEEYDVLYCYISYLDENKRYEDIQYIVNNKKVTITTQKMLDIVINSLYEVKDYDSATNMILKYESISYELYCSLKNKYPNLFTGQYLDKILEYSATVSEADDIKKIIKEENKPQYMIIVLAKHSFEVLRKNLSQYLGEYDDLLLKVYQHELIKRMEKNRRQSSYIPQDILEVMDDMKKMKNGKYYICYIINEMLEEYFYFYKQDMLEYCKGVIK